MKYLLLIFIALFLSCKKEKKVDYVIFSGTIENPIIDSFPISDINNKIFGTIHLAKDNSFYDTLFVPKGYYYLNDRNNVRSLFLNPSKNLKATIYYKENVSFLAFQGNGANENNYLQQKFKLDKDFEKVENPKYFLNLNEQDFLKLSDSINNTKTKLLKSQINLDNDFMLYEGFSLEGNKASLIDRYRKWRGTFIDNKDFKVSNNFPNPYKNIELSNEKLLTHPYFIQCLREFISYKMEDAITGDESLTQLITIDKEIKNQLIKDKLAYETMKFGIAETKMLDAVYNKYLSMVKDKTYKQEFEETYLNLKKISKGTVSPTFELYDINDKLIALESLKGKLVYIDIWATWCIPCINEIPALKELEKEFKNKDIQFVSMCLKDSKEQFEKLVKEKELGGIQLFAPDENISFFKEYFVNGIPRFILIDKVGKIINANAYKPSNPKLKKQILEYL